MIKDDLRIPDMVVPRVLDIDFEGLAKQGRFYYLFDLDNTLVRRNENLPHWPVAMKIRQAQTAGWMHGLVIISNVGVDKKWLIAGSSRIARVRLAAEELRGEYVACVFPILKPNPKPFWKAIEVMGARPEQVVVVGDQISKDIAGGNRVGAFTILVDPLGPDMWLTAIIRHFKEQKIRARLGTSTGAA